MIKPDDLATLHIHRLIFHDVPKRVRGLEAVPVLSEIEATLDEDRIAHLKRRLVRVLGSKSAYDIHFRPDTQSPVPPLIRDYTKGKQHPDDFVPLSQKFAQFLFEQQGGASSSGVLSIAQPVARRRTATTGLSIWITVTRATGFFDVGSRRHLRRRRPAASRCTRCASAQSPSIVPSESVRTSHCNLLPLSI